MATEYEAFFPEVLPHAPDVAEPVAINAIRNACIDFCEATLIWREAFELDAFAAQAEYALTAPTGARRAAIVTMWYDGTRITPTGEDSLAAGQYRDWREIEGVPRAYVEIPGGGFRVAPVPQEDSEGGLTGIQAFAPSRDSTEIGLDYVHERWVETIAHGALARLYGTPGATYYQPELAMARRALFLSGVAKAKAEVNAGNGRGRTSVAMNPFVRGRYPWA